MYSIAFAREATKALAAMPSNVAQVILVKIEGLARNPFVAPNVKKLVGTAGYRLRVGDWRVLYTVEADRLVVHVLRIGARGGIYK